jgi:hypothetical protein
MEHCGVGTYHKPFNTLRSLLVHPKDKTPTLNKCGVIYKIQCPGCPETYIGETGRALATRMKEHTKKSAPFTAIGEHCNITKHDISAESVSVIARESNLWRRKIRESIEIRAQGPALNRDSGYELPAIYDKVLPHVTPHGGHVT